jgi:SAM-dependent methyltransferase
LLKTFRDPAGQLELRVDGAYRVVRSPHDLEILAFLDSPLAHRLVAEGKLIGSTVVEAPTPEHPLQLRHPRVAFVSYCWEWSPSMWLAAANLTLSICADLLAEGWILKDATPSNILFVGTRPVLVDVLSVAPVDPAVPLWFASGQFIRTFLLPLLASEKLGWPLQASMTRRDGYEPEEIGRCLSFRARWSQPARSAVTLPLLVAGRSKGGATSTPKSPRVDAEAGRYILGKTIANLEKQMERLTPKQHASTWSNYTETATHYTTDEQAGKQTFVSRVLTAVRPARVLDIGCNTGTFSEIAAAAGAEVVAVDTDEQAVDRLFLRVCQGPHAASILPLHIDLSRPTPATGWENQETASFLARCEGHFDFVLMLAVIHHLLLQSQIPLEHIAALAARITTSDLIIEWVPPTDEKFREVLRGRDAIYQHLTEDNFRAAFAVHFDVVEQLTLTNARILFHMRRRPR